MSKLEKRRRKDIAVYITNNNKPTDQFGKCPKCQTPDNKIQWGWTGVYYNMICKNGHYWTYSFNKSNPNRLS